MLLPPKLLEKVSSPSLNRLFKEDLLLPLYLHLLGLSSLTRVTKLVFSFHYLYFPKLERLSSSTIFDHFGCLRSFGIDLYVIFLLEVLIRLSQTTFVTKSGLCEIQET